MRQAPQSRAPRPVFARDYQVLLEHLRGAVKESGVSQVEIARRLGKGQPYVSKVLHGRQAATLIEMRDMLRAAGVAFLPWVTGVHAALEEEHQRAAAATATPTRKGRSR